MLYTPEGLPESDLEWVKAQLAIANKKLENERREHAVTKAWGDRAAMQVLGLRRQVASLEEQLAWAEQQEGAA